MQGAIEGAPLTAIASLLAGGEYVDDVNALRAGRVGAGIVIRSDDLVRRLDERWADDHEVVVDNE